MIHDTEEHGRGRPPAGVTVKPMKSYMVTLPPETHARIKAHGKGNVSAGIRKLAECLKETEGRHTGFEPPY